MRSIFVKIRSSIARKLIITYLIIVFIPVITGGLIFSNYARNATQKEYRAALESNLQQLSNGISEKLDSCIQSASLISGDSSIVSFLQAQSFSDSYLISSILTDIVPKVNNIRKQNTNIYTLRIIQGNSNIPNVEDVMYYIPEFAKGEWNQKLNQLYSVGKSYDKLYLQLSHDEVRYVHSSSSPQKRVFTLYKSIYSTILNRMAGVVELNILQDKLISGLKTVKPIGKEAIVLVDDKGVVLYNNKPGYAAIDFGRFAASDNISPNLLFDGHEYMIIKKNITNINCSLISYVRSDDLLVNNEFRVFLALALAALIITLSFISVLFSRLLLKDLHKLKKGMEAVKEGELSVQVIVRSKDEFGRLATIFNDMVINIKTLMFNLEQSSVAEKDAIYKALDNQIRPHFLCNALDMVRATAELENNMDVANSIGRIMNYFMYNTSKYGKFVSLKDELKNAVDYIEVYNLIGKRHVEYSVEVNGELDGRLTEYNILKFVLQPIVENAVLHGFRDRTENCFISLDLAINKSRLIITIEDNGVGITEGRLQELRAYLNGESESIFLAENTGIGLKNIDERLRLSYGSGYQLAIASFLDVGTRVTLSVETSRSQKQVGAAQ